ncbi:MAG: sugar/nucleoside kinase (ribokinase family) [Candidatus Azotimanducaceae bacterium]|jgi:sugar/nucleoside kinase (ribokinase family)
MKKYDVYGIGNALVDTEYEIAESFISKAGLDKGLMTLVDVDERHRILQLLSEDYSINNQCGGGSAANTMVSISQLGAKGFYSCKVSSDEVGDFFMTDLKAANLNTNLDSGREAGVTGQCISMVTPDAERTMNTHLGISESLSESELDEDALRQSRYLYIEGYLVTSPTAVAAALKAQKIAQEAGVIVSITLSDPAIVEHFKDAFDQFAERGIDLVFCNEDEAMIWTASKSPAEAFNKLQTVCKQVAMTCGADGAMVFDGEQEFIIPGIPTKAVDTTGAGDIFAGAFLYGISQGMNFEKAAILANKSASSLVSKFGARLDSETINALK